MLAVTHLLLVLLLICWFELDQRAAFATLLFGVFIDVDHIFGMMEFVIQQGWENSLNVQAALSSDIQWKSLLHSPEGILFVAPVVLASRMVLPLVAWALHLLMDHVQINYLGIASPLEFLLIFLFMMGLLHLDRTRFVALGGAPAVKTFLRWEVHRALWTVRSLPLIRGIRRKKGPQETLS